MNIKKLGVIVVVGTAMLFSAITLAIKLRPNVEIEISAGNEEYRVNGVVKAFDENTENLPYIDSESQALMLPLRTIMAELKGSVSWNGEENAVVVVYQDKNLWMHTDSSQAALNGYAITLPQSPVIQKGSVYVPADFFKTYFGTDIQWDEEKKQITIKTKRAFQPVVAIKEKSIQLPEGGYQIQIPVVTGLNDGSFEKSLNLTLSKELVGEAEHFLNNARILYQEGQEVPKLTTFCTVAFSRQEMISILIRGQSVTPKSSMPIQKAINIDLQGQKKMLLEDLFKDKNQMIKLLNSLNIPVSLETNGWEQQFYFNEKQQLVLFSKENGQFLETTVDWEEIEGLLKPGYRFFTTANLQQ